MKTYFRWSIILLVVIALGAAFVSAISPGVQSSDIQQPVVSAPATPQTSPNTPPVIKSVAAETAAHTKTVGLPERSTTLGTQWSYDVRASRTLTLGAKTDQATNITLSVSGILSLTVTDIEDEAVHLLAHLDNVRFGGQSETSGQADEAVVRSLETALEVPFFVTMNTTGRIDAVHFRKGTDDMARGLLKSLVTTGQMVRPADSGVTWEVEETDSTGDYVAKYQADTHNRRIQKSKVKYVRLATASGLVTPGTTNESFNVSHLSFVGTVELGADGWPASVTESEELSLLSSPNMPAITSAGTARWVRVAVKENREVVGAFAREWSRLETAELAKIEGVLATDRQHDEALVAGEPLPVLLNQLKTLPDDDSADADRAGLMVRLQAGLRLEPKGATSVMAEVINAADQPVVGPLLGVLGGANTPEAREALKELVANTNLSTGVRADAASHLGQAGPLTQDQVETLWDGAADDDIDLQNQSLLALGAAVPGIKTQDPARAMTVVEQLVETFTKAATDDEKVLVLQALGNTGDAAMLPAVELSLLSPNETLRAAAVMALRFVQNPTADAWITAVMVQDEIPMVRNAAIGASVFRQFGAMAQTLETVLKTDPATEVRQAALMTLAAQLPAATVVLPTIVWAAENDVDEEVRLAAAQILESAAGL